MTFSQSQDQTLDLVDRSNGLRVIASGSSLISTLTSLIVVTESQVHDYRRIDRALKHDHPRVHELFDAVFGGQAGSTVGIGIAAHAA